MDIVYKRCCGADIHKQLVVACCVDEHGKKEIKSFGTMTDELLKFCGWLKERKIEMVAMESTGPYWKPIFNLLEVEGIPAILVNAQHVKNVPGRKTDVKDSEWIADLLRHGLLKPSFVQCRSDRETKELTRYRTSIIEERAREYNRLDKVLQGANIKLSSVASSMHTQSGMDMINAIARGEFDEMVLASLAKGSMKNKREDLERALKGYIRPHQQMILSSMLSHIEALTKQIEELDAEIDERLADKQDIVERLDEITGVGAQSAQVIVAEIGSDMSRFPSSKHLTSWAGVSPGQNESAGKKKAQKPGKEIPR
jgi:transposase